MSNTITHTADGVPVGTYRIDIGEEHDFTAQDGTVFVAGRSTSPVSALEARRLLAIWPRASSEEIVTSTSAGSGVRRAPQRKR